MEYENNSFMISSVKFSNGFVRNDFHHHQDYEIIFITCGEIEMEINHKLYHAGKNSILFITDLENHCVKSVQEPYQRYTITLRPLVCDRFLLNLELLGILKNHISNFVHCIDVSAACSTLKSLFEKLLRCSPDSPYANDLVNCYITELLIEVYQTNPQQFNFPDIVCKEIIIKIQKYLDLHFSEDIKIADIGKKFGISACYLSHKFKELSGFSPKQYLTSVRLKNAAAMLYSSRLSVSEIAFNCGFHDVNNFIRLFKKQYQCLPVSYRKKASNYKN